VVVGEFNTDGRQDLAVSNYNDNNISILLGEDGVPPLVSPSSNSPVCFGETILLIQMNAVFGSSYEWTGPNSYSSSNQNPEILFSDFINSGIYTVAVTSPANCTATASTVVTVNPLPVVAFDLQEDTFCFHTPVVGLTGGTPPGGTYHGPGVINGNQFDPNVTGPGDFVITYRYTDTNGCVNSADARMIILVCTEIDEGLELSDLKVYPNPVTSDLNIETKNATKMSLYTSTGILVKEIRFTSDAIQVVDMNEVGQGIYFLCVEYDSKSISWTKINKIE
jgi:hypothetical protein